MADRYGNDVLSGDWKKPPRGRSETADAERGLVVEEAVPGFCGEIMRVERDLGTVELEDRKLVRKVFPLGPGFLLEGPFTLPARLEALWLHAGTVVVRTPSVTESLIRVPLGKPATVRAIVLPPQNRLCGNSRISLTTRYWG